MKKTQNRMKQSFDFMTVSSAEDALDWFHEKQIDLLVIDIEMPGMNGIDLAKEYQKKFPEGKIIFISGSYNRLRLNQEYNENNEYDPELTFFEKPFDIKCFLKKIEKIMQ